MALSVLCNMTRRKYLKRFFIGQDKFDTFNAVPDSRSLTTFFSQLRIPINFLLFFILVRVAYS